MRSRFFRVVVLLAALLIVGWSALDRWQVAQEEKAIAALKVKLSEGGGDATEHHRVGLHVAKEENKEESLAHLEMAAEHEPDNLRYGNDVRMWCIRFKQHDRSIRFFEKLVNKNPDVPEPRLQLALTYVDKMPDHMMGIVGQGKLSKQSINQLTKILENEDAIKSDETRWSALYALGMNHLYWPKAMRHAPDAIAAFKRCVEFQKRRGGASLPAYYVLPHVCLGDAYVKNGQPDEARKVWKEAAKFFPDDERLKERLAMEDNAKLTEFVDKVRGLGIVIDTDLTILWGRKP
jgi:tetratricopeptide (TPR) repeat protein